MTSTVSECTAVIRTCQKYAPKGLRAGDWKSSIFPWDNCCTSCWHYRAKWVRFRALNSYIFGRARRIGIYNLWIHIRHKQIQCTGHHHYFSQKRHYRMTWWCRMTELQSKKSNYMRPFRHREITAPSGRLHQGKQRCWNHQPRQKPLTMRVQQT